MCTRQFNAQPPKSLLWSWKRQRQQQPQPLTCVHSSISLRSPNNKIHHINLNCNNFAYGCCRRLLVRWIASSRWLDIDSTRLCAISSSHFLFTYYFFPSHPFRSPPFLHPIRHLLFLLSSYSVGVFERVYVWSAVCRCLSHMHPPHLDCDAIHTALISVARIPSAPHTTYATRLYIIHSMRVRSCVFPWSIHRSFCYTTMFLHPHCTRQ